MISVFLFSCVNKKTGTLKKTQGKPKLSIAIQHGIYEKINAIFEKEVANWQELNTVHSFIQKFDKVSPNEALSNALELRDLVTILKDSVTPSIFDIPSFQARVNILHNETLRLADLTLIPAITFKDVNLQVDKILAAFSSVNSKINTILSKKQFEDAVDIKIDYIGIDPTKMDSASKKTISFKRKDELVKKKQLNSFKSPLNKNLKKNNKLKKVSDIKKKSPKKPFTKSKI
tara:strand:- start:739 stop:1431 length:693 start_codon:yes stop_codon:yes gene_type:complete